MICSRWAAPTAAIAEVDRQHVVQRRADLESLQDPLLQGTAVQQQLAERELERQRERRAMLELGMRMSRATATSS
jgi:hypothetical protein